MREKAPPFQKAVELLGRRSHFRRELEAKLTQRGYDEVEVAATLERLEDKGLVDDTSTAREFVRQRMARRQWGWRRLVNELRKRGVESEVAADVVNEVYPEDDTELTRTAAERHRGSSAAGLARYLERRGFSRRAIVTVLREAGRDDAAAGLAD